MNKLLLHNKPFLILIFIVFACWSCSNDPVIKETEKDTILFPDTSSRCPHIDYKVVSSELDSYGYINKLDVFINNSDSLSELNKYLLYTYLKQESVTFQVYYYDDNYVAKHYRSFLDKPKISDKKIESMAQHNIGFFEWVKKFGEPKGHLTIGKDALEKAGE